MGLVAAIGGPVRYVVRLAEGTDPGEAAAVFDSEALPGDVVNAYAERCRTLKIAVRKLVVAAAEATLICEGDPAVVLSDDAWVIAERAAGASVTQVRLFAGSGLTATYGY